MRHEIDAVFDVFQGMVLVDCKYNVQLIGNGMTKIDQLLRLTITDDDVVKLIGELAVALGKSVEHKTRKP